MTWAEVIAGYPPWLDRPGVSDERGHEAHDCTEHHGPAGGFIIAGVLINEAGTEALGRLQAVDLADLADIEPCTGA